MMNCFWSKETKRREVSLIWLDMEGRLGNLEVLVGSTRLFYFNSWRT
jgi:hypothetical protein